MSHAAIAAVLARPDLAAGERLVAFSLASFANREQLAWPGLSAAAARAGLGRSRYLDARDRLARRRLLEVETRAQGRGQASGVRLLFAQSGPWWDGEVNVELVEAVLGYSQTRGSARLLVAALAAISDEHGVVEGMLTEELCRVAGLANSTYRRARTALLRSAEVCVDGDAGGRGRTSRWTVRRPVALTRHQALARRRRAAPARAAGPLMASVRAEASPPEPARLAQRVTGAGNGPILSGVPARKGPILTGVQAVKRPMLSGVSDVNPAKTPPETPPRHARAGTEPQNPRTIPPHPPEGGDARSQIFIEERFRSSGGRLRRRRVTVDIAATCVGLNLPRPDDVVAWNRVRGALSEILGESMFEIWLAPIEVGAVDADGALVLVAPQPTRSWIRARFAHTLARAAESVGRQVILADEAQSHAIIAGGVAPNAPAGRLGAGASAR